VRIASGSALTVTANGHDGRPTVGENLRLEMRLQGDIYHEWQDVSFADLAMHCLIAVLIAGAQIRFRGGG
jgi:hypothetical protein